MQGVKLVTDLKAYEKMLADARRDALPDPTNPVWVKQLATKTEKHDECLAAIGVVVETAARSLERCIRSETASMIEVLVSEGALTSSDSPHPKESKPDPVALQILQKTLGQESREREEAIHSQNSELAALRAEFVQYKNLNEARAAEYRQLYQDHQSEIQSLKTTTATFFSPRSTNVSKPQSQQLTQRAADASFESTHQAIEDRVSPSTNPPMDLTTTTRASVNTIVEQVQRQVSELGALTTSALAEIGPELQRAVSFVQSEVNQTVGSIITHSHQQISELFKDTVSVLSTRIDHIEQTLEAQRPMSALGSSTHPSQTIPSQPFMQPSSTIPCPNTPPNTSTDNSMDLNQANREDGTQQPNHRPSQPSTSRSTAYPSSNTGPHSSTDPRIRRANEHQHHTQNVKRSRLPDDSPSRYSSRY